MKTSSKQSGVSLIEVMVVLVVLLIGILSVVRLFPPGFLVNKHTEETTLASRLAKQEADRYSAQAGSLMDAIVPLQWDANTNTFVIAKDIRPDDLTDETGNAPWDYYFSNANRIRRVMGESVRIPVPKDYVANGNGAVYMLSSGPFMDMKWDNNNPNAHNLYISGAPMSRRVETDGKDGSLLPPGIRPSQYVIDYENGVIGFSPQPYPRTFQMTYSYYDSNGQVQTAPNQSITIAADDNNWHTMPGLGGTLVSDGETVGRQFIEIAAGDNWNPNDPYQYKVISSDMPGSVPANVGAIGFNPNGRSYMEPTAYGMQPLTAKISYDVLDWHVIHEDRGMPASSPFRVTLTLKELKKLGDFENDQSVYDGLLYGAGGSPDILVYDVANGQVIDPTNYTVDYKAGTVMFTDAFGSNNSSVTFRFYYKAHGDWSLQVQKACSLYNLGGGADVAYNQYYLGGASGSSTRMYFSVCEAGKSVSVREYWYRDASGNLLHANNESFRINANPSQFFHDPNSGRTLTWIDIRDNHNEASSWNRDAAGQPATGSGMPVQGVQGISFRTRVLWNTGSTVNRDVTTDSNVVNTRWHRIDLDTVMSTQK